VSLALETFRASSADAREPSLQVARSAWARQDSPAFMPGCGARLAREQPHLHWLASAIASMNRGAGQAVWQRNNDGKFDATLNARRKCGLFQSDNILSE